MQSYKDLEIYQLAHGIALDIHKLSLDFPKHELYEEGSQIRRASKAVSANIVEGFGRRRYKADYVKFLIYAHSSCDETREHWEYLYQTGAFKDKKEFERIGCQLSQLSKMLNGFIKAVASY